MTCNFKTDIVIIGAGISGLWLNKILRQSGYSTLLLEKKALGGLQSMRSQGIIHGGTKYTLHGSLSNAANAISSMPERWRACLRGDGEVDLRQVKVLSEHHYMWSRDKLMSKLTSFFASKAIRGKVAAEAGEKRPEAFQHEDFRGNFYALNELVLDMPTLVSQLVDQAEESIYKFDCSQPGCIEVAEDGSIAAVTLQGKNKRVKVTAQRFILTAGEGNESLLHLANLNRPAMQRRPLHMVIVKHNYSQPIYAHCIGAGSKPLITITSHWMDDGQPVWYLGGNLAETGVELDRETQIASAKTLIKEVLPWVDLGQTQWGSFMIHRAEPQQRTMLRPDTAFVHQQHNILTCWPTKLALTPHLADEVMKKLESDQLTPQSTSDYSQLRFLSQPKIATPIWQELLA